MSPPPLVPFLTSWPVGLKNKTFSNLAPLFLQEIVFLSVFFNSTAVFMYLYVRSSVCPLVRLSVRMFDHYPRIFFLCITMSVRFMSVCNRWKQHILKYKMLVIILGRYFTFTVMISASLFLSWPILRRKKIYFFNNKISLGTKFQILYLI